MMILLKLAESYEQSGGQAREALNIYVYLANMITSCQASFSDPRKPSEIYKAAGDKLLDLKEWKRAIEFLQEAFNLAYEEKQKGPIHESLGEAHFQLGSMETAQEHYKMALKVCSSSLGADAEPCRVIRGNLRRIAEFMQSPDRGIVDR